ncbi:MAG: hypothetical protein HGA44_09345, partial [Cellulomonadaceae bacterium]|nr:hypothetical protein [Cellulomonadaceae bacterium]
IAGAAFAIAWTPCVGPALASILGLAATQDSVAQGGGLLAVYSLGLAVPFLLAAVAFNRATTAFGWIRRRTRYASESPVLRSARSTSAPSPVGILSSVTVPWSSESRRTMSSRWAASRWPAAVARIAPEPPLVEKLEAAPDNDHLPPDSAHPHSFVAVRRKTSLASVRTVVAVRAEVGAGVAVAAGAPIPTSAATSTATPTDRLVRRRPAAREVGAGRVRAWFSEKRWASMDVLHLIRQPG